MLDFATVLKGSIAQLVHPHADHIKTVLTGVLIAGNGCEGDVYNIVTAFRFSKAFKWYLHGWCEIRFVVVDLRENAIVHNLGRWSRYTNQVMAFYKDRAVEAITG